MRELCNWKGVEILEANACADHIHMLLSIPPKISVSSFMGFLKGKSSLMIFERFSNLKYKYGNRHFWCRGYYVDTVGKNKKAIEEYIKNQQKEDMIADQISMKEYMNPFKGSK
ncbi:Mobile element protein [Clostridium tyrobutyricum DIVETGP]|uniref:Mobile element protein n=1 Tax=Clostridium tyrobutyricum DIVETGP TaxID=1408889 RepID=W6N5J4_CLOTY|nr:transposase [Clostridium tyrobutyricum]CDL91561.1 Mobile element protein [Clostridium tyrobutyricum DIVETGP]